jgi:hypothetical protein
MKTGRGRWIVLAVVVAAAAAVYLIGYLSPGPHRPRVTAKAPSRAAVAALVRDRLVARQPGVAARIVHDAGGYALVVGSGETQQRLPLEDLYRSVTRSPRRRDALIAEFLAHVAKPPASHPPESLDEVRDLLLPMLKPKQFVIEHNAGDDREVKITWTAFPNGLALCFVVDYPDHVRYVTIGDLHRWERTVWEVRARAIQNLAGRTQGRPMKVSKSDLGDVYFYDQNDGYDAARILALQRQRAGPDPVWKQDLIVAIPDRDLLAAAPVSQPGAMRAILTRIRKDAASREHALTDQLFLVTAEGVKPYVLPPPPGPAPPRPATDR